MKSWSLPLILKGVIGCLIISHDINRAPHVNLILLLNFVFTGHFTNECIADVYIILHYLRVTKQTLILKVLLKIITRILKINSIVIWAELQINPII